MSQEVDCPIKMNTYDEDGQAVICMAEDHFHCGGCYQALSGRGVYCSAECREMVESYDAEEP